MSRDGLPTLSPGLTRHTVLLCLNRQDHALRLRAVLEQEGYAVEVAMSYYEASSMVAVALPHILVAAPVFKDADVSRLRQQMNQNSLTKNIPVIALVPDKSEKSLRPLQGYSWRGILIGPPDPKAIVDQIKAVMSELKDGSPYLKSMDALGLCSKATVRFPAEAVGRSGDRVVFRSTTAVDRETVLRCEPVENSDERVELHQGVNLRGKHWTFNIFPFSQQRGPGRAWMKNLPHLDLATHSMQAPGKIIWQEANPDLYQQQAQLMRAYDLQTVRVDSAQVAIELVKKNPDAYAAAYLQEITEEQRGGRVALLQALMQIPKRPTIVIASRFPGMRVDPTIRFLPFPTGVGRLIDAIEAALEHVEAYSVLEQENQPNSIKCNLFLQAEMIALDEAGGILLSPYPLEAGSRMIIENADLEDLWRGQPELEITSCLRDQLYWDRWQIHFTRMTGGTSRLKYWQQVIERVA